MPQVSVISGPGFDIGVDYVAGSGAINGVYCNNTTADPIPCTATLTNNRGSYSNTFPPGTTNQQIKVPPSYVTVTVDPVTHETTFNGLQSVSIP